MYNKNRSVFSLVKGFPQIHSYNSYTTDDYTRQKPNGKNQRAETGCRNLMRNILVEIENTYQYRQNRNHGAKSYKYLQGLVGKRNNRVESKGK